MLRKAAEGKQKASNVVGMDKDLSKKIKNWGHIPLCFPIFLQGIHDCFPRKEDQMRGRILPRSVRPYWTNRNSCGFDASFLDLCEAGNHGCMAV